MSGIFVLGLLTSLAGLMLLSLVRRLSRLGRLKFAYAVGWGLVGLLSLLAPAAAVFFGWIAQSIDVPLDIMLPFIGMIFLISVSMQLSISVSGHSRQLESMAARVAELEYSINTDKATDHSLKD